MLSHMVILYLTYWGTTKPFSMVVRTTFSPTIYKGSDFSTSFLTLFFSLFKIYNSHPCTCVEIYHCSFYLHFSSD